MNVVVFGATGMVGQAALIECLEDPGITRVVSVVRRASGRTHPKLEELVHADFTDYSAIEARLGGLDACLWCLGITSLGLDEAAYTRITYDFTVAGARTLLRLNPALSFCFISGASTDSTEQGPVMWARVKGKAENAVLAMTPSSWCFRPGFILAEKGISSATPWMRRLYSVLRPVAPLILALAPRHSSRSSDVGKAMIAAVRTRPDKRVLEVPDINALAAATTRSAPAAA